MNNSKNKLNKKDINDFRNWADFEEGSELKAEKLRVNNKTEEVRDGSELIYGWRVEELRAMIDEAREDVAKGRVHEVSSIDDVYRLMEDVRNGKI